MTSFLEKRALFDEMMCETGDVFTRIVPGNDTVLPPHLPKGQGTVLRWVGAGMPNPVVGLETDATGIHAVLSFGAKPERVFVSWDDVHEMACDVVMVGFPAPAPQERPAPKKSEPAPVTKKVRPSHLKLVK